LYRFLTIARALAVVISVLIAAHWAWPCRPVRGRSRGADGVITGAGALAGHLARQRATWRGAAASVSTTSTR
jgi:hypothetical protein